MPLVCKFCQANPELRQHAAYWEEIPIDRNSSTAFLLGHAVDLTSGSKEPKFSYYCYTQREYLEQLKQRDGWSDQVWQVSENSAYFPARFNCHVRGKWLDTWLKIRKEFSQIMIDNVRRPVTSEIYFLPILRTSEYSRFVEMCEKDESFTTVGWRLLMREFVTRFHSDFSSSDTASVFSDNISNSLLSV